MNRTTKKKFIIFFILLIVTISLGVKGEEGEGKKLNKVTNNDYHQYIAINQILMWISNNGDGSHDPRTDGNGFYWPGGINAVKSAIFQDGLIYAGKIGREVRMNGNTHRQGLQAGKILPDGNPDNPGLEKYRVYKIRKGWEGLPAGTEKDAYERDYNEWPVEDGAPWVDVDGDGAFTSGVDQPDFVGDEVLWYVANDLDPARSTFTYGSQPLGLEFQTTIFGFNRTGALGDMVFKKYKIINKGGNTIRDMYIGYWSDTDLGNASDDFTGCDTTLSLGYTYNGDNNDDGIYGTPPPAVGYDFFQGPIIPGDPTDSAKFLSEWRHGYSNLPMTSFAFYINGSSVYKDPDQGVYTGTLEFYNYMQGLVWNGEPFIDPHTQQAVKFVLTGDPVAGTGWYEGPGWPGGPAPDDRRHLMIAGPFNMAPSDTQEIVVGLVIAQGSNNLNSVTILKAKDIAAQIAYDLDFQLTESPPNPVTSYAPGDGRITLVWQPNVENYDEGDPLIFGQGLADTTYSFEGYRVFQYRDQTGTDPVELGVFDLENGITDIEDVVTINGVDIMVPIIRGNDLGVRRTITIEVDAYTNGALYNGNPYYFAVTAYGYSPNSAPLFLESPPRIIEVIPGRSNIETQYTYDVGDNVILDQTQGFSDAVVRFKVVDPERLTGHNYAIEFYGPDDSLKYRIIDKTTQDTLLSDRTEFVTYEVEPVNNIIFIPAQDTLNNPVIDGFMPLIQNIGSDSITSQPATKYRVKGVYEVNGPSGEVIDDPINVFGNLNSTGVFTIKAGGSRQDLVWQALGDQTLGYKDYELRFTGNSGYYISGYQPGFTAPVTKNDTLSLDQSGNQNTVPFTVWDIGRTPESVADDKKLVVKVLDRISTDPTQTIPDRLWSQLPSGSWEQIFAFNAPFSADELPFASGTSTSKDFPFGAFIIEGQLPETGTVLRIESYKPLTGGDVFEGVPVAPKPNNELAKNSIDNITVFPNPYFGANNLERDKYQRFVRFTRLPQKVIVRIFSLSGVFIQRIDKDDNSQYLDWDLRNKDGLPVASGMYIAYLELPGIGSKIMKIAVILETQYIDRL